jgi:transposase
MAKQKPYPEEVRDRAVRLVLESQSEHGSQWAAIVSVADKLFGARQN